MSSIRLGSQGREAGKGLGGVLRRGLPACHKCQLLTELFRDHRTGGEVWRWPGFYHPCESALTTIPGPDSACPVESGPLAYPVLDASRWPDDVPVPSFGSRMVCTKCGTVGADVRPNWWER
jgi:hypothetical protein